MCWPGLGSTQSMTAVRPRDSRRAITSSSRCLYAAACRLKVPGYRSLAVGSSKRKGGSLAPALQHSQRLVRVALVLRARRRGRLDDGDLDRLRDRDQHGLADHRNRARRLTIAKSDDLDELEMLEV